MKTKIIKMQVGVWYDFLAKVNDNNVELVQIRKMADGSKEFKTVEILQHNDPLCSESVAAEIAEKISAKLLKFE